MLICHCNGVSDRTIRRLVREGASTVVEVGHACGAGACCGGCTSSIQRIIRSESRQLQVTSVHVSPSATALA